MTFQEKNKATRLLKHFLQLNKDIHKCLSLRYTSCNRNRFKLFWYKMIQIIKRRKKQLWAGKCKVAAFTTEMYTIINWCILAFYGHIHDIQKSLFGLWFHKLRCCLKKKKQMDTRPGEDRKEQERSEWLGKQCSLSTASNSSSAKPGQASFTCVLSAAHCSRYHRAKWQRGPLRQPDSKLVKDFNFVEVVKVLQ